MSSPYVGEIRMVGFNFAPAGWALCDGSLLAIAENETLFNLIGTTYGGDGQTTFALPDMRSRIPMHQGSGHVLGEMSGVETVTLTVNQLPQHTHLPQASSDNGNSSDPAGTVWAQSQTSKQYIAGASANVPMSPLTMTSVGGSQPHDNMLPYQAINFVISLFGIYPTPA